MQEQCKCVRRALLAVELFGAALYRGRRAVSRLAIGRVEQAWLAEDRRARLSRDAASAASLDTRLEVSALIVDRVEAQLAVTIEQ